MTGRAGLRPGPPNGDFALCRIGDAISVGDNHATIYDALRLMKDI
jgi:hypothetical protein